MGPKKNAGETLLALGGAGILFLCAADRDADLAPAIYWGVIVKTKDMPTYKKFIFIGIIITTLGITLSVLMKENLGPLGIVFIAAGGLLFISGMAKKQRIK